MLRFIISGLPVGCSRSEIIKRFAEWKVGDTTGWAIIPVKQWTTSGQCHWLVRADVAPPTHVYLCKSGRILIQPAPAEQYTPKPRDPATLRCGPPHKPPDQNPWRCQVRTLRRSCRIASFFDVVNFKSWGSCRIVSFLMLSSSKTEEVSQNSFVLKLADRQIDRELQLPLPLHYNYNYNYNCNCIALHYANYSTLHCNYSYNNNNNNNCYCYCYCYYYCCCYYYY